MPDHDAALARRASTPAAERRPTDRAFPAPLRGDEEELYRALAGRLRARVHWLVRATHDQVDDACAFAWLTLLRAQPGRETVYAWLTVVAVHEAWRLAAADAEQAPTGRWGMPTDAPPLELDPAAEPFATVHARERLRAVAAALPERRRRIVGLQALGYRYEEIAAITGASPVAVNHQLVKARRRLDALRTPIGE